MKIMGEEDGSEGIGCFDCPQTIEGYYRNMKSRKIFERGERRVDKEEEKKELGVYVRRRIIGKSLKIITHMFKL